MKKEISFLWESEKRIRVAVAGVRKSLFYEAYRQALAGVAEIVRASIMNEPGCASDPFFPKKEFSEGQNRNLYELYNVCDQQYLYDYPNNMIVFSGERGAGKSSAMLTFVKGLENKEGPLFKDEFLTGMVSCELPSADCKSVNAMLQSCKFEALSPIDPTTLEDDGQILTVILARMFHLAINTWENEHDRLDRTPAAQRLDDKNQLIQQFSTCYEHISSIKRKKDIRPEYEGLDALAELGDSALLKAELSKLVKQLLRFRLPEAGDFSYLVLQIDDTDMNIKQAYAILEDIRRYLVIPRLVIVMAADLKHLTQVVWSSLLKDYDKDLGSRQEYVDKITRQYITKLFPQTRQINLPSLGTYFKEHTENITIRCATPNHVFLPDYDEKGQEEKFPDAQEQIFRLIYRKTGMVFLKQKNKLHPIIPGNMRLLAHFLSMLIQMENVEDPDDNTPGFFLCRESPGHTFQGHRRKLRTRLQNVQRFRNYFLTTWVANVLEDQQLFGSLERIDIADRVRYVCMQLHKLKAPAAQKDAPSRHEASSSYEGRGRYVDMAALCRDIAHSSTDEDLRRLIFAVQTYFSLLAHEVALEDLIDYYDQYEEPAPSTADQDVNGSQYDESQVSLGCSFSRLHMLFGSHIFPYPGEKQSQQTDQKTFIPIQFPNSDTTPGKDLLLNVLWRSEKRGDITDLKVPAKQCGVLLYSMLAEYQDGDGEGKDWLDLSAPIINCLYLGDNEGLTPFLQAVPGSEPLRATTIGWKGWHQMGNSALLTVLNSDVQQRIGDMLWNEIYRAKKRSSSSKIEYHAWIAAIKELYNKMKSAVSPSGPSAIACLDYIRFDGWLNPLDGLKVKQWDPEAQRTWNAFVLKLNKNITPAPAVKNKKSRIKKKVSSQAKHEDTSISQADTLAKTPEESLSPIDTPPDKTKS